MLNNFKILYDKDKNNFNEMINNELINPKILIKQNESGQTILHYLVNKNDNNTIINILKFIKSSISETDNNNFINFQDNNGDTALHIAIKNKNYDIAKILDKYGANKNIPNNNNEIIETSEEIELGDKNKLKELINKIIKPINDYNSEDENIIDDESKDSIKLFFKDVLSKNNNILKTENLEDVVYTPDNLEDIISSDKSNLNIQNNIQNIININMSKNNKKSSKDKKYNSTLFFQKNKDDNDDDDDDNNDKVEVKKDKNDILSFQNNIEDNTNNEDIKILKS